MGAGARDVRPARALGRAGGRTTTFPRRCADMPASRPAAWSPSRGIHKDPMHIPYLGPSGRVPEEFLDFGPVAAGEAVHLRAVIHVDRALSTFLAVGASAAKRAWLDGRPVALDGSGYLAAGAVELPAGRVGARPAPERGARTSTRCAPTSRSWPTSTATRARSGCGPPAASPRARSSRSARACRCRPSPTGAEVLVGANGPCRVLVDGTEVGRQGGFDPYAERDVDRLQPYDLAEHLRRRRARAPPRAARARPQPPGRAARRAHPDARRAPSRCAPAPTGPPRADGADRPIDLRLDQRGDPAHNHAWRRPHPLPERRVAGARAQQRGRGRARDRHRRPRGRDPAPAPGHAARRDRDPHPAGARLPRDGRRSADARSPSPGPDGGIRAALDGRRPERVRDRGRAGARPRRGGALLTGPVAFTVGPGEMELVDWQEAGLPNHSGAVRYRRRLEAPQASRAPRPRRGPRHGGGAGRRRERRRPRLLALHVRPQRADRSRRRGARGPRAQHARARTSTPSARRPTCSRASGGPGCSVPCGCSEPSRVHDRPGGRHDSGGEQGRAGRRGLARDMEVERPGRDGVLPRRRLDRGARRRARALAGGARPGQLGRRAARRDRPERRRGRARRVHRRPPRRPARPQADLPVRPARSTPPASSASSSRPTP